MDNRNPKAQSVSLDNLCEGDAMCLFEVNDRRLYAFHLSLYNSMYLLN